MICSLSVRRSFYRLFRLFCVLQLFWVSLALGQHTIVADPADAAAAYDTDTDQFSRQRLGDATINLGRQGPGGRFHQAMVIPFQLPDLGEAENPFQSASFAFYFSGTVNSVAGFNLDLYGLAPRGSATVLPSSPSTTDRGDFYMGGFDGWPTVDETAGVVKLQDNILTSAASTGSEVVTSIAGSTALVDYLNAAYDGGEGVGKWIFLRLTADATPGGVAYYSVSSANHSDANRHPRITYTLVGDPLPPPAGRPRPFIWVTDDDKPAILDKIDQHDWAGSLFDQLVSRAESAVSSHRADRDAYIRGLPVEWDVSPARFKTIPAFPEWGEGGVRSPAQNRFNAALDSAILYYLTGDTDYAALAADILHNAVTTLIEVEPSSNANNGGWIFQNDFLKGARATGTQLAVVYDFLHDYLMTNQVYDVQAEAMVDFADSTAQAVFLQFYRLARDRGFMSHTNWHALMATTMLNNLLALNDESAREAKLDVYLVNGTQRQKSLAEDYQFYAQTGNIWPESLQYVNAVATIRTSHLVMIDRYDPDRNVFETYPNLPLTLPRVSELVYPNGQLIRFGDGPRIGGTEPFRTYEMVYQQAVARGYDDLAEMFGARLNAGIAAGQHDRSVLPGYSGLGQHNEPLFLLWGAPEILEEPVSPALPRTDRLPFAGITLQRNPSPLDDPDYGLMGFVGGAGFVHSSASGMNIELYGAGHVLGAKGGRGSYGTDIHENYYRLFAAHNTIIVNGASRGQGGWQQIDINTVQNVAMEPNVSDAAVSPRHSFSVSSFEDNRGSDAEATQQRTLAVVRTSPVSGFYVDIFRSESAVTSRTATTLEGSITDQYHDYIYRNVGALHPEVLLDGSPASLYPQADRFQNDIGDGYEQPGWRYFENTQVTYPTNASMQATFVAAIGNDHRNMRVHMPAVETREFAMVESPPIVDAPSPYGNSKSPTLVIRQIGEAWDRPFTAVYEPYLGSDGHTVQSVTELERNGVVVGVKVESFIAGVPAVHYVIANPEDGQFYEDPSVGLSFEGRFGIVADLGNGFISLYLGEGTSISYQGRLLETDGGISSQAEVRFVPGEEPDVAANTAVTFSEPPAPTVSPVADQEITRGMESISVSFTVSDETVPAEELIVAAVSDNPQMFPAGSLVVSGSGVERTLVLTPAPNVFGAATVTITADNGAAFGGSSFNVTIDSGARFASVLPGLAADTTITDAPAVEDPTRNTGVVGMRGNAPFVDRCAVFVFRMPDFGETEDPFVEARFSFDYRDKTNSPRPVDLYGLAPRSAPTVLATDYFGQTTDPDPTPGSILLQSNILDNSTSFGVVSTSSEAGWALVDYLNDVYDNGTNAGKYVFLRLNTTVPKDGVHFATIGFSEGGSVGPPDTRPRINFTSTRPHRRPTFILVQ